MRTMALCLFLLACKIHEPKMVYVCDSRGAKRYHLKENCRGLRNCTYRIIKITEENAKGDGKTLCHFED